MTRIAPLRITHNDRIIIDFLNGTTTIDKVRCDNPEAVSKAILRRVRVHKLEGLKVHLWNGKCFIQISDQAMKAKDLEIYRLAEETMKRMKLETKARAKQYVRTHRNYTSKRTQHIGDSVNVTVDAICYDFSDPDRSFMKSEISKKLSGINTKGRPYHAQVAAMIYLLSKCPANADKPLQFKEVYRRYCAIENHTGITAFYDAISFAKERGIQSCRINCEMVITSKKDALLRYATDNYIPDGEMREIMGRATAFADSIRREMQGKNPFVTSASAVYYCRGQQNAITQKALADMFDVTEVSIRNTMRRFNDLQAPAQQYG